MYVCMYVQGTAEKQYFYTEAVSLKKDMEQSACQNILVEAPTIQKGLYCLSISFQLASPPETPSYYLHLCSDLHACAKI